jgi:hypothetical protein
MTAPGQKAKSSLRADVVRSAPINGHHQAGPVGPFRPSRPGEFHPEPLTDSGLDTLASSGSCHRAKAAAFRRELELLLLPVGSLPTSVACPLRSTGITPLQHYYGAVRPSPAHQYFRPRGWSRLCLFPWHRRPGSHVPYKSQIELRAASMPDAAWAVSGHPPS